MNYNLMRDPSIYNAAGLSAPPNVEAHVDASEQTVVVETLDSSLEIAPTDNLLDALIDSGHEIEYQCRGGYCGACRTKVISGKVSYDEPPLAHLDGDDILPCCCRVKEPLKLAVTLREGDDSQQGELFSKLP